LAACWVAENCSHTDRTQWRGLGPSAVWRGALYYQVLSGEGHCITKCCLERGIVLPSAVWRGAVYYRIAVKPDCRGLRNGCYTVGFVLPSSVENSQILCHSYFRRLWVRNKWCGDTELSIHSQKVQHLDQ
jgi:hypothetical protein